jgi:hypothetical protein
MVYIPKTRDSIGTLMMHILNAYFVYVMRSVQQNTAVLKRGSTSRKKKKESKFDGYTVPQKKIILSEDDIEKVKYYYYFYTDKILTKEHIRLQHINGEKFTIFNEKEYTVVDSSSGAHLYDENNLFPIFILIKRDDVTNERSRNASNDVENLSKLLEKHSVDTRGEKRKGICKKYCTFGHHAQRKGGVDIKKVSENLASEEDHLKQMCTHMTHKARYYLPFRLPTLFDEARKLCGSDFLYNEHSSNNDMFNSMAVSLNYNSPAHVDVDACIAGLMVIHSDYKTKVKNDIYTNNQEIAVYFLFPSLGVAVALRPGDHLLFNPIYPHHVSQRTPKYKEKDVYLASFYVKNKVMTGNDNSIEIRPEFMEVAEHLDEVNRTNDAVALKKQICKQNLK